MFPCVDKLHPRPPFPLFPFSLQARALSRSHSKYAAASFSTVSASSVDVGPSLASRMPMARRSSCSPSARASLAAECVSSTPKLCKVTATSTCVGPSDPSNDVSARLYSGAASSPYFWFPARRSLMRMYAIR